MITDNTNANMNASIVDNAYKDDPAPDYNRKQTEAELRQRLPALPSVPSAESIKTLAEGYRNGSPARLGEINRGEHYYNTAVVPHLAHSEHLHTTVLARMNSVNDRQFPLIEKAATARAAAISTVKEKHAKRTSCEAEFRRILATNGYYADVEATQSGLRESAQRRIGMIPFTQDGGSPPTITPGAGHTPADSPPPSGKTGLAITIFFAILFGLVFGASITVGGGITTLDDLIHGGSVIGLLIVFLFGPTSVGLVGEGYQYVFNELAKRPMEAAEMAGTGKDRPGLLHASMAALLVFGIGEWFATSNFFTMAYTEANPNPFGGLSVWQHLTFFFFGFLVTGPFMMTKAVQGQRKGKEVVKAWSAEVKAKEEKVSATKLLETTRVEDKQRRAEEDDGIGLILQRPCMQEAAQTIHKIDELLNEIKALDNEARDLAGEIEERTTMIRPTAAELAEIARQDIKTMTAMNKVHTSITGDSIPYFDEDRIAALEKLTKA